MGTLVHAVKKSGHNVCDLGLQGHSIGQCFGANNKWSTSGAEHKHTKVTCVKCLAKLAKKGKK